MNSMLQWRSSALATEGRSQAVVLLLRVIPKMINQAGSLNSSVQTFGSGNFLAMAIIIQTVLSRSRRR